MSEVEVKLEKSEQKIKSNRGNTETNEAKNAEVPGTSEGLLKKVKTALSERLLADEETPVLLMVSGGSDSTALAYLARQLHDEGLLGPLAMLHVNHQLRGEAAEADARFVGELAALLDIPLFSCEIDIAGEAARTGENIEAVARRERYLAADTALESLCFHSSTPLVQGRILTAHTVNDRVENFYMRSIVGTGPGGFRSMLYRNGPVVRPLMDVSRDELRAYIDERERTGLEVVCDAEGKLWREDATNAHTDRFRAYVRHEIVPLAQQRNPQLMNVLARTMNLIADEDDMLEDMVDNLVSAEVTWIEQLEGCAPEVEEGCVFAPAFGKQPLPLQRRGVVRILQAILGHEARIEAASVDAVLAGWEESLPKGGYVANIQGNLAISANKQGVRLEPMAVFRARRKRS